jgi:hypothetical protein
MRKQKFIMHNTELQAQRAAFMLSTQHMAENLAAASFCF